VAAQSAATYLLGFISQAKLKLLWAKEIKLISPIASKYLMEIVNDYLMKSVKLKMIENNPHKLLTWALGTDV
jgi:hypothetical protein